LFTTPRKYLYSVGIAMEQTGLPVQNLLNSSHDRRTRIVEKCDVETAEQEKPLLAVILSG
jgi:hypothetical protein